VRANHFGRCECSMKPMFARVASAGQRAARQDRGPGVRSVNIITSYTAASSTIHARYRGGSTAPRQKSEFSARGGPTWSAG